MRFFRSHVILALAFSALIVAVVWRNAIRDTFIELAKPPVPSEQPRFTATPTSPSVSVRPSVSPRLSVSVTPEAINLAVPFSAQAPRGDWSLPWQEACEETSALLVDAYWRGTTLSVEDVESEILRLVAWQQERFGYYQHTTAAETGIMLREVYGYHRVDVEYGVGTERIAEHVRAGRPVIVPLAGRLLENKYYTQPGPAYHMLVVKGIAENGDIITNDVGTRHGRNLTYTPAVFLNAMHDVPRGGDTWPADVDPAEYIKTGRRAIIVVYPNK